MLKLLNFFLKGKDILCVDADTLQLFVSAAVKKGLKETTVRMYYNYLNNFYRYCCQMDILKDNPVETVAFPLVPKKLPSVLSLAEVKIFLGYVAARGGVSEIIRVRDKLMVELFLFCGIRRQELCRLKREDILIQERSLKIIQGKHKKGRLVPLNDTITQSFLDYFRVRPRFGLHFIFVTEDGQRSLCGSRVGTIIRKLGIMSGVKTRITPHQLRYTFASLLFDQGVSIKTIQELLGHSDIDTTSKYIRVSTGLLRREIMKHPLLSLP